MTMTTGNFPKLLWPGINKIWGLEYEAYEPLWTKLFDQHTSEKAYEEDVLITGFGLVPVKPQGQGVTYDSMQQGYVTRYVNVGYGLGYIVTHEEVEDNLYLSAAQMRTEQLAFVARNSKEIVAHGIYNNAFNAANTFGDGVQLISTAHPTQSGNQSNTLSTVMELCELSLETLVTNIRKTLNHRGMQIHIQPTDLIIPPELEFDAHRILNSVLQNDTANNAVNVLKATGVFKNIVVSPFLTNAHYYFVRTNCPNGMKYFEREKPTFADDNDFDTMNLKYKFYERYSVGNTDWRGIFGVNAT